jgi:hypothetical protein
MRLASVHPGVSVGDVVEATGFPLAGADGDVPDSRAPSDGELAVIEEVDPNGVRYDEVPD